MASNINVNVTWRGQQYTKELHKNLKSAVTISAMMVIKTTKQLLNESGQNAATSALNRVKNSNRLTDAERIAARLNQGRRMMHGSLTRFKIQHASGKVFYGYGGGTYTHTKTVKMGKVIHSQTQTTANRIYWYGEPLNKWVMASNPGDPPHKQLGDLQKSIDWQKLDNGLNAKVGPKDGLVYARAQELGWKHLPPRPYLEPAFQANIKYIAAEFAWAIQKTKI